MYGTFTHNEREGQGRGYPILHYYHNRIGVKETQRYLYAPALRYCDASVVFVYLLLMLMLFFDYLFLCCGSLLQEKSLVKPSVSPLVDDAEEVFHPC